MPQRIDVPGMGVVEFPDGMSDSQIEDAIRKNTQWKPKEDGAGVVQRLMQNLGAGAVRGAGSIGATLLSPIDAAARAVGVQNDFIGRTDRREAMDAALKGMGADTDSISYGAGKLGAEVAGTLGVGGLLSKGLGMIPGIASKAAPVLESLRTAGFSTGGAPTTLLGKAGDMGARMLGGGAVGAGSAGLVNPEDAELGGVIGAALPPALKAAGAAGSAIGNRMAQAVSPEVKALATRAADLGVDVPADRLVRSRPLDAVASGLNYIPFSGRAATEARMNEQLTRAASRLVGQDTPNINVALRNADQVLGAQFDRTLKTTGVALDKQLLDDVAGVFNTAQRELGPDALKAIGSKVDDIIEKGATGVIDGQAAYNIKRELDRIGKRTGPEAWHAIELKKKLMDALNRSLGPDGAQAFAKTREQYGNMLELEKLARNGVEGELSIARLANMKNINNKPLQEIADIAAQFVRPREAPHGSMQRAVVALASGATGGLPGLLGVGSAGRAANTLLNSGALRGGLLGNASRPMLPWEEMGLLGGRIAPVLATD